MSLLSVIVPCYNEEENVPYFYEEFLKNKDFFDKEGIDFEIIYVDDGSKDNTASKVKELREKDERVRLYPSQETLEKRLQCTQALGNPRVTT